MKAFRALTFTLAFGLVGTAALVAQAGRAQVLAELETQKEGYAAVAAKTLAITAVDLFEAPEIVGEARTELEERRGPDFEYWSSVGDRAPPLDCTGGSCNHLAGHT